MTISPAHGTGDFLGADAVGQAPKFVEHDRNQLGGFLLACASVDTEQAAIEERQREGIDRIDQTALLANFLEQRDDMPPPNTVESSMTA